MRTHALALVFGFAVAAGFAGTAAVRSALADDPAPLTETEQARVKQLIENLGSDDFLIREGASKSLLTEFGARAKPALTAALKHESPEVRFRADQLIRRIDGQNRERPVDPDVGVPPAGGLPPAPGQPPAGWHRWLQGDDAQKWAEEMEKRFREIERRMQEEMGRAFGPERFRLPLVGSVGNLLRQRHFVAEGAQLDLNLRGGAKLTLTEAGPDGQKVTTTYEGKSLDDILATHPDLKGHPGVASIINQVDQVAKAKEAEKKAAEDAAKRRGALGFGGGFTFQSRGQGVQIESTPGHVKVTVTETGPDGQETTKTYEGTDLESLKKEHPELADKVGGIQFHFGGGAFPSPPWWGDHGPDGQEDEGLEPAPSDETGPFGLQIGAVEEVLRTHLGLDKDAGALVRVVRPKSQADELGLKPLDVITAVNGKSVTSPDVAVDALRSVVKGTALSVDVIRSGKPLTLTR